MSVMIDGVEYQPVKITSDRHLVRCRNAGVHAGTIVERTEHVLRLRDANRIWRWRGANTLSEVSQHGVNREEYTRIACMVPELELTCSDVCEVIPVASGVDLSEVCHD